jgi:hypothetical protein
MKRALPVLAVLAAGAIFGAVAWFSLAGAPAPAPPAPAPPAEPAAPARPRGPQFAPERATRPTPAAVPPEEPPVPPENYPWETPGWWHEVDRKFRQKEVTMDGETMPIARILEKVSGEVNFPVRTGPELQKWAEESRLTVAGDRITARALLEGMARRLNLDMVLTPDALLLHQRGKAPDDALTRAGRVQWALKEAEERRTGLRDEEPAAQELRSMRIEFPLDGVPMREAARRLGEKLGVPVYMDAPLWNVNPAVHIEEGERTLRDVLDRMTRSWDACYDVTPRCIVLFRPAK